MTESKKPPFRADHVGSLLRPQALLEARDRRHRGEIPAEELRAAEDEAIRDAVRLQENVGLRGITDGEFRRTYFHVDFLEKIEGVTVSEGKLARFHSKTEEFEFAPPSIGVGGKLERAQGIQTDDFDFLAKTTSRTPKVCVPSPTMTHFRVGRAGISREAYPDIEAFYGDLARVYREEIADLADLGCRYIQLDDTNLAYLCDPAMRERTEAIGEDPDELPHTYARLINDSIRDRPADMAACIHLCRGNFQSAWVAEGGYEPVAEALFNEIDVDGFFLEYDTERAGDFSPLRHVPNGKMVVLGLVTTKEPELEPADDLKRRIDEAATYVPLEWLAVSPQCGFASTVHGNRVTVDDEIAKLARVVEVAEDVWGAV